MNTTVRTFLAGAAGAAVATTVLAGQPAVADQVAHQVTKTQGKVTSAMIKNGTVKRADLNADVRGALGRADSALQGIPNGSVTAPKLAPGSVGPAAVADGSLTAADLGKVSGTSTFDFPNLTPGACVATVGVETGRDLTGDLILVSNPPTVSGSVQMFARQDPTQPTRLNLVACSIGTTFDPPPATFSWMAIDA